MNIGSLTATEVMSRILVAVKLDESPLMAWELSAVAGRTPHLKEGGDVVTGMFHLEPVIPARS
ncbi:hypothetical protein [Nonomuraea guangzhouensis]|uniref:Uncharacterized protein n=1 Tax=Nonomuraea guangzhouensis TaxID=1291555 RepID=A0ABW4GUF0_9ACTN|nr:hypothetical protein [Nonomuraea guangzhouensis]